MAGLGVDDGKQRRNEAWWFSPEGRLVTNYLKHFMAPPEREFVAGDEFPVNDIAGVRYGVAICKDMHFASLGRGFGERRARVMLIPAWDFDADAWMAANMTKLRGIENGYVVVRSSRQGLLSVSDGFGRMLAVERKRATARHHAVCHGHGAGTAGNSLYPQRRPARMGLRHCRAIDDGAGVSPRAARTNPPILS